jgi:hypothetical protein
MLSVGFQDIQRAQCISFGRELWYVEADPHMTLGRQVINLIRLYFIQQATQGALIEKIAVVRADFSRF